MTQRSNSVGDRLLPTGTPAAGICPVCEGRMETIYSRGHQDVSVCADCGSDLTVPTTAWEIAKQKQKRSA